MATAARRKPRIVDGSCWACRKRRIKCDLGKPVCTRCHDNGEPCDYNQSKNPIRWVGGMAMRGHLAHSNGTSPSATTTTSPLSSGSKSSSSPEPFFKEEPDKKLVMQKPMSTPIRQDNLLMYFTNVVLPRFQLPDKPFEVDEAFFFGNETLQQATLAISHAHYMMNGKIEDSKSGQIERLKQRTRHSAIQSFRKRLTQGEFHEDEYGKTAESNVSKDQSVKRLFMVNVMLCILDGMVEPSNDFNASTAHLRGGFAMLSQWSHVASEMLVEDGLPSHLISVFATMDLVHALLSGDKPFFNPMFWKLFADVTAWWGCLEPGNAFLNTLKVLSEMAVLGSLVRSTHSTNVERGLGLGPKFLQSYEERLEAQASGSPEASLDVAVTRGDSDDQIVRHWEAFCDTFRLSGRLYLLRALKGASIDDAEVQSFTRHAVAKLLTDPLPGMLNHCTVFPILIFGSHCIHVQDRPVILRVLKSSTEHLAFGNLPLMESFLMNLWSEYDRCRPDDTGTMNKTWWEMFDDISQKAFFF